MQDTALWCRGYKAQMLGAQALPAFRGKGLRPCNARALPVAACSPTHAFTPSKTAVQVSGSALPMAQRFFALSGITPLTGVVPVG